jgi:UDP-2,3-diacylglucosamine pyrophosphatase LpxH
VTTGKSYRTLFIGDLHLGSPHSQAERLLPFIRGIHFERLVLVGDIFDDFGVDLPKAHYDVVRFLLRRLHDGVSVVFVPGNHDRLLRHFCGHYGNLRVVRNYVHITANSKRLFVLHGDEVDTWNTSRLMHWVDRVLPIPFWELLHWIAMPIMRRQLRSFERRICKAFLLDVNLVLCGHVHAPALRGNYANVGDWVKHCSAIVEHWDGTLELVRG